jgi:hypothetical protein
MQGMYWGLCRAHTVFFVLKTSQIEYSVVDCIQRYVKWNCSWMCHKTHSQLTLLFHTTINRRYDLDCYIVARVNWMKVRVIWCILCKNWLWEYWILTQLLWILVCRTSIKTLPLLHKDSFILKLNDRMQATQSPSYSLLIHWHQAIMIMLTITAQGSNTRRHKGAQEGIRESKWQLCKLSVVYR